MKKSTYTSLIVATCLYLCTCFGCSVRAIEPDVSSQTSKSVDKPTAEPVAKRDANDKVVDYKTILALGYSPSATFLQQVDREWHPGAAVMLVETAGFSRSQQSVRRIVALLEKKTGQSFGTDFNKWYRWVWSQPYQPHPQYAEFKRDLYSHVDRRFANYFKKTKDAKIRLDEIRWGGVVRDGIPPLKTPKMISAKEATYLDDSNVVFGISLNGDARCYPKRILAWHEMFKDTIGGESVCGAY